MSIAPGDAHKAAKAGINHMLEGIRFDLGEISAISACLNIAGHPALKVDAIKIEQLLIAAQERLEGLKLSFATTEKDDDEISGERDDHPVQGDEAKAPSGGLGAEV